MQRIIRTSSAPKELVAAFAPLAAATVYESNAQSGPWAHHQGQRMGAAHVRQRLTVRCFPADNLMLHTAIAIAQPGDVIVADVGGLLDAGYWGEITTVAAQAKGVVGLVIAGARATTR